MSQRWLIAGNSRGIGRALAEAVLAAGHHLVGTTREPAQLARADQLSGLSATRPARRKVQPSKH